MLLSLCTTYAEIFLAQGVGVAAGCAIAFNVGILAPSHWFLRRRAMANGIVASGASVGGTILPIMARKLIEHPNVGYGWCMRIFGFMGLTCFIPSYFCLRQRLQPRLELRHGGWKRVQWVQLSAFRSPAFVFLTLGGVLIFLTLYNVWTYIDIFTSQYAIPQGTYFLSILNGSSTFGRILPGIAADKIGRFNMIVPMCVIASVMLFVWPLATALGGLIPASILYGISSGLYICSSLPSFPLLFWLQVLTLPDV